MWDWFYGSQVLIQLKLKLEKLEVVPQSNKYVGCINQRGTKYVIVGWVPIWPSSPPTHFYICSCTSTLGDVTVNRVHITLDVSLLILLILKLSSWPEKKSTFRIQGIAQSEEKLQNLNFFQTQKIGPHFRKEKKHLFTE